MGIQARTDPSGLQTVSPKERVQRMRGAPQPHRVFCGKDIGNALRRGLNHLENAYKKLPLSERMVLAFRLYDPVAGLTAWDVQSLIGDNPVGFGIAEGPWGTGEALGIVTVDGSPQWGPAVNYILWGRINRLIHDDPELAQAFGKQSSLSSTISTAALYRALKSRIMDHQGLEKQVAWAMVGWTKDWSYASQGVLKQKGVVFVPCPKRYNKWLQWRVGAPGLANWWSLFEQEGIIDFTD